MMSNIAGASDVTQAGESTKPSSLSSEMPSCSVSREQSKSSNNSESNHTTKEPPRESARDPSEANFECNICLDTAKDAVVSLCGHLFCWPCLHQWLETKPRHQVCPVCKAGISKDKVIPLYGRGSDRRDPRDKLPPRPPGQRSEPDPSPSMSFPGFGFGDGGFHMSFGIGAFPFGFFASTFNFGDGRPAPSPGSQDMAEDQLLGRIFLWVAILFIFWLLIA